MSEVTYIFEGTEVKLTGRTAERKLKTRVDVLREITPADNEDGGWKKWVRITDLYKIE